MERDLRTAALAPVVDDARARDLLSRRLYTAGDLMRLTGMTRKQVTYWAKIGLVRPSVRDSQATTGQPALFYIGAEVVKALVVCELRRAGFSLQQVQQVARNLGSLGVSLERSESYLLTDGVSVFYAFNDQEVVDVMRQHRQLLLLLPIHEQIARLEEVA
jgi:DNA-binding transcriptional MerR regulator